MLIDLLRAAGEGPDSAETIIVGAGAVGLTMAVELTRAGRTAIVLEAGGRNVEPASQEFFKAAAWRNKRFAGLHLGRFRALGGTTNFWGGQLVEFDPIVFEARPWLANAGWPISRQVLDPFYQRAYELLGLGHRLTDEQVWQRMKVFPPTPEETLAFYFSVWAPQPNLASLFKEEIRSAANLHVYVNAPVTALELEGSRERVESVIVRLADGGVRRFSGKRIVLANGTIEIARLLKISAADCRVPWHGNKWLGRGFMDHIDCFGGQVTPIDKKRFHDLFDNAYFDGVKYVPKLRLSERAQRTRKLLGVTAFFLFSAKFQQHLGNARLLVRSLLRGQFDHQLLPHPWDFISSVRVALPMIVRYLRHNRVYNPDGGIELRLMGEQVPLPESALHLCDKRDALGMPLLEMEWRIDGREIESLATTSELVAQYLEEHRLASVRLEPKLMARDPSVVDQWSDYCHHMGMARMADTPQSGVVDRNLNVFGTRNLYIAGAAVYPTTGFGNPTFTAIALGLRLADAIASDRAAA
jgi:hypothetical protein